MVHKKNKTLSQSEQSANDENCKFVSCCILLLFLAFSFILTLKLFPARRKLVFYFTSIAHEAAAFVCYLPGRVYTYQMRK